MPFPPCPYDYSENDFTKNDTKLWESHINNKFPQVRLLGQSNHVWYPFKISLLVKISLLQSIAYVLSQAPAPGLKCA